MISKEEVKHIAKLARLGLAEDEIEKFQKDLSSILDYIEKLKEVNIEGVEPTSHSFPIQNITRTDEAVKSDGKKMIDLAPEKKDGYIKVKSVFKG